METHNNQYHNPGAEKTNALVPQKGYIRVAIHLGAMLPLLWLVLDYFNNALSVNPIQIATQRTGKTALILLVLTLAVTPLNRLVRMANTTGWLPSRSWFSSYTTALLPHRRTLGLYTFFYAVIHVYLYTGVDYGFSWGLILDSLAEKRFILVGAITFIILLALAVTSFKWWMKKLGRNWKRLHKMIYLAGLLAILHYGWALKGDLFNLSGNVFQPALFGISVIILLVLRIPGKGKKFPTATQTTRSQVSGETARTELQ